MNKEVGQETGETDNTETEGLNLENLLTAEAADREKTIIDFFVIFCNFNNRLY